MPLRTRPPKTRKTTDILISPEARAPVETWLQHCSKVSIPETRLGIDTETREATKKVTACAKRTPPNADIRLRLTNDLSDALAEQARFWESCMDELPQAAREHSPNTLTFLELTTELATDLEMSIKESNKPPRPKGPKPNCRICGKAVESAGAATVDMDSRGTIIATYKHNECA